jgi:hypothetical protein
MENNDKSGQLFDTIIKTQALKNDAALSRLLKVLPPQVSKIRHGKLAVGDSLILNIHERLAMPVAEIRRLIAS